MKIVSPEQLITGKIYRDYDGEEFSPSLMKYVGVDPDNKERRLFLPIKDCEYYKDLPNTFTRGEYISLYGQLFYYYPEDNFKFGK